MDSFESRVPVAAMLDCIISTLIGVYSFFSDPKVFVPILIAYGFALKMRQPTPRKGICNKAVFITGCDSGMGHRIARHLDSIGLHVFAGCLNPNGSGASELKAKSSKKLHIVPLDITNDKQVQEAAHYVAKNIPIGEKGLYCLINNAGILSYVPFDLMTVDMCQQVIDVNLTGTIRVTKHFLPLITKMPGRIISITSILARMTYPSVAVYSATKHGLNGFFSSLRYDFNKSGIRIAMIEPGDFSRTTDIMQWTRQHLDEMWQQLTPEERIAKQSDFDKAKRRSEKPKLSVEDQERDYKILLDDVEDALLNEEPKTRYVSAPLFHRFFLWACRTMPEMIGFKLIAKTLR